MPKTVLELLHEIRESDHKDRASLSERIAGLEVRVDDAEDTGIDHEGRVRRLEEEHAQIRGSAGLAWKLLALVSTVAALVGSAVALGRLLAGLDVE